jgi:AcrR family transcriptional regulator
MSQIAEDTGIGRATLYKYFPDVEAILIAWHDRQIASHLGYLAEVGGEENSPGERLEAVLQAYALISHESRGHRGTDVAGLLHRGERVTRAEHQVHNMIQGLVTEAGEAGDVRDDITPGELASFCLNAIGGAAELRSKASVRRLVAVTFSALSCRA